MKKRFTLPILAALTVGLIAMFATSAMALPSYGLCSSCHTLSTSVKVTATQKSNNGATASYGVAVSGPNAGNGWAVYQGSTRITYATGASGTFSVVAGKTYTVYGGNANGSTQLYNKITISPVASSPASGTSNASGTTDPTPLPTTAPTVKYVVHFNLHRHSYKGLKAKLRDSGHMFLATVNRKGTATFPRIPAGVYRLSATGNSHFKFKAKSVRVGLSEEDD